jgi:hypothetical protein
MAKHKLEFVFTNETRIVFLENLFSRSCSNGQFVLERSGYMVIKGTNEKWPSSSRWGKISSHKSESEAKKAQEKLIGKIQKELSK